MVRLDTLLLDHVFQPAADRVAEWMSCFALARLALLGAVLLQLLVLVDDLLTFSDATLRLSAGGIAVLGLFGADQGRRLIVRVERQARVGTMNVRRITLQSQRVAWIAVCLLTLAMGIGSASAASLHLGLTSLAWVGAIFFASCTQRPPSVVRRSLPAMPGLSRAAL